MSSTVVLTQTDLSLFQPEPQQKEDVEEVREAELITFDNCSKGLGIKICGGCSRDGREINGIFVKRVLPGGLADIDGNLQHGDQILEVNGDSFEGVTNERAVSILRLASASNHVEMVVTRDDLAKREFREILEKQNGISVACTPTPGELQQSKSNSRATTPSGYGSDSHVKSPRLQNSSTETESSSPGHSPSPRGMEELHRGNKQTSDEHVVPNGDSVMVNGDNLHSPHFRVPARRMVPSMTSTPHTRVSSSGNDQSSLTLVSPVYTETEISMVPCFSSETVSDSDPSNTQLRSHSLSQRSNSSSMSRSRKLSLDPSVRLKIEKLELALRYLGLDPTIEQELELRQRLRVDVSGTVVYGDFVAVVREMFHDELLEKKIDPRAMLFAANDLKDFMDPPAFKPRMRDVNFGSDDYQSIRQERDDLRLELQTLKLRLNELECSRHQTEEDLCDIKRKAQGALDETWSLRKKVQIAERAQKEARNMEKDYEEVVQLLEGELAKLRLQLSREESHPNSQQKIAILMCQLKKAEAEKKTYEVATEKLLQFAENVHETIMGHGNGPGARTLGEQARGNRPPAFLGKHKTQNPKNLATEAKEVVSAVRSIIEKDHFDTEHDHALPYGWEEAYTADGMKYYINHVTQTTTWSHPKSGVQQASAIQEVKRSKQQIGPAQTQQPTQSNEGD